MDGFDKIIALTVDEMKSPKQRSAMLAKFAREEIRANELEIEAATGRKSKPVLTVDGRKGGQAKDVKPDGTIIADFNVETEVVEWVLRQLELVSPRKSGRYEKSHRLFVDGVEHSGEAPIPEARDRYVIISVVPYARKIEGMGQRSPLSSQAPGGVYQAVAAVAQRRFGNQALVTFGAESVEGGASDLETWAANTSLNRKDRTLAGDKRDEWLRRQPAISIQLR